MRIIIRTAMLKIVELGTTNILMSESGDYGVCGRNLLRPLH